jgi:hypothetical protein
MKLLIMELSEREAIYVPAQGDRIDMRISEWIKNSGDTERLTRLFFREGEGVYQFGSKRIYIKLE